MKRAKLWGGRFSRGTHKTIERFTHSLSVDQRLLRHDLRGSIAHARMLGKTGIIPKPDSAAIARALSGFLRQAEAGTFRIDRSAEDIHTVIQQALEKKIGAKANRLHTARSRNDQVVTALRLYCKEKICGFRCSTAELQREILKQASVAGDLVVPGCTHLRHAQPVLAGHIFVSYITMLERDRSRLKDARERMDELPLGSGALAGTTLPIDRGFVARELGFARVSENSIDAVSDRDFAAEFLAALSLLSVHLSRIAEDLILWSTDEFGFLRFDESLLTGSSMMPQKQNPDFLELTRGGSARIIGNMTGMLNLLKGLPTGYQRDLQNDKELLFEAIDRVEGMLAAVTLGFRGIQWNRKKVAAQLADDSIFATDLAEYLVKKNVPFAQAHQAVGKLLSHAGRNGGSVRTMTLAEFRRFSPVFDKNIYGLFDPAASVRRKRSAGSTHPAQVRQAIRRWKTALAKGK